MQTVATCNLCEALCGILVEHQDGEVLGIRGNPGDVLSQGHLCPKATALKSLQEDPDRLRRPVRREGDRWVEMDWPEALDAVAERLAGVQEQHGRDAVAVYAGNPVAHNYASLLMGLVFARALGSRSRFSATSVDQLPHMFAALEMFGHQFLLPIPDVDRTHLMIVVGGNPAVSNGSLMTAGGIVRRLKALRARGGRLVVCDPRRTETAQMADTHHFVRPGTDALVFLGMLHVLFAEDLVDDGAWRQWTHGLETLREVAARFPPARVAQTTGLSEEDIAGMARELATAESACLYGRLGVSTQRYGGLSAWLVYVLNLLTGNLDRPGGVMFTSPAVDLVGLTSAAGQGGSYARRHSRVRGLPEFGGELPVSTLAEEIETPGEGQLRALVTVAGNPVISTPNGERLAQAIGSLDLVVSLDMYVTATSRHADFILPACPPLERDHFGLAFLALGVRDVVKYAPAVLERAEGSLEDWEILCALSDRLARRPGAPSVPMSLRIARRLGPRRLLDLLLRTGHHGRWRHPVSGHRLSLATLAAQPDGIDLGPLKPALPKRLKTASGKVNAAPEHLVADLDRLEADLAAGTMSPDGLVLIGRRQLRSNNSWLHNDPKMVSGKPRCTLLVHPEDARARGLSTGDRVEVRSRVGAVEVSVELDEAIMAGVVSLPHGWGHRRKGAELRVANATDGESLNDLTDEDHLDALTGTAGLNGVPVTLSKAS
ncbi:MAG: molybdopterin-dependent oxidoreductase [Myxococcota bacterium]|nr:molybdopterin-dependent oxidoreductase [Myxococcota bacterium]